MNPGSTSATTRDQETIARQFLEVRSFTEALVRPLSPEDCALQSMPDASPTLWHLAHTSWFFETFVIAPSVGDYRPFDPAFNYLFNSYYNAVGAQHPRAQRGLISRPALQEIHRYRAHVDGIMRSLLAADATLPDERLRVLEVGCHHEQQHQELILTDLKHLLSLNPAGHGYRQRRERVHARVQPLRWTSLPAGVRSMGHAGKEFAYDNESPRHRVFVEPFSLATRLVTNGEYLEFIESGGYQSPEHWLSIGWQQVRSANWNAPLYWRKSGGGWSRFTLYGEEPLDLAAPVSHISFLEADAYAKWCGARLPTEAEWEVAAESMAGQGNVQGDVQRDVPSDVQGNLADNDVLEPAPLAEDARQLAQMFGDVWEWTSSSYAPYPGFTPWDGALGEYNGKFMCNQYVLRGGSCATPASHIRRTYRNFFPAEARWQFSGIRLARGEG